eukprot:gb/GFBE01000251.1/.p1 GENE.gb/GFBE01000251.1/~~gb/GFBE01000251.1/.p1  ORF type:complete len:118 (+),score=38.21 gb/GFBE01000251.1/:1-354(+)
MDEIQQNQYNYAVQKEISEWNAELKRSQHAEQQKMEVEEHLEQTNFIAEYRLEEQQRQDLEQKQDRAEAEYREMQLAFQQASKEREMALEALEHVRGRQHSQIPRHQHIPVLKQSRK